MNPLMHTPLLAAIPTAAVYVMAILGSMLLCYGIFQVIVESRTSDRRRLQDRLRGNHSRTDKAMETILRRGALQDSSRFADKLLGKLSAVPKLQTVLDQADIPWSASQTLVNLFSAGLLVTVALVVFQVNPLAALGCGAAVVLLPILALNFRRRRRMSKLNNQLPDVFEMMSQALRAGHSLAGAIQLIHEQMTPPIATEFGQVYHEQNLGLKIEDALLAMANRVDSLDVKFFVTAVIIQRQTGGDLAEILDNIGSVIRQRIELRGLVKGLTAEGRLSGWVLFALPFVVFAGSMVLNPDYGSVLLNDPTGKIMLMIAFGMQLMGLAMIRWIVNIKV